MGITLQLLQINNRQHGLHIVGYLYFFKTFLTSSNSIFLKSN